MGDSVILKERLQIQSDIYFQVLEVEYRGTVFRSRLEVGSQ